MILINQSRGRHVRGGNEDDGRERAFRLNKATY